MRNLRPKGSLSPALSFREGEMQALGKFLLQRSILFIEKEYKPQPPTILSHKCGIYDRLSPTLSKGEGEMQADGKFLLQRSLLFIEKEYKPQPPTILSDKCGIYDQKNTDLTPALSFREGEIQGLGEVFAPAELTVHRKEIQA
jgi:hypothetical protein